MQSGNMKALYLLRCSAFVLYQATIVQPVNEYDIMIQISIIILFANIESDFLHGVVAMDKLGKRIYELQSILEATKLLNSSNDVNYILNSLMNTTLKLLERADIGVIFSLR